jgi:glucose-6-phosphate isomerase
VVADDLEIPGRPFTFGSLHLAQALGDLGALTGRGRPAVRLHLTERQAGLEAVLAAIGR